MAIRCTHPKQVNRAEELLSDYLGSEFEVNRESLKKPKILVTGIESELSPESIVADINERNFNDFESECIEIHSFTSAKSKLLNVIVELTPELYSHVRANNYRVYVGHQRCRAYDDLNVRPCYKCGRYGHCGSKCKNPECCVYCAGPHEGSKCPDPRNLKCLNCLYVNEKFKLKRETNHCAMDSEKCHTLKTKINKYISTTDYPIRPIVPALLRRAERKAQAAGPGAAREVARTGEGDARGRVKNRKRNVPPNDGNG